MTRGPVVVLGAGGHAKVVIEILRAAGETVAGVIDADPTPRRILDIPVIGTDADLSRLRAEGLSRLIVAVGDNALRLRLGRKAQETGFALAAAVHPGAVVSPSALIGGGAAVMAGAAVNAEARLGELCIVNTGAVVDHDGDIGLAAHVAPGCALAGNVTVGERAFLGVGVSAIPGVRIGEGAQIGAGACVVSDIPANVLALGVPARVVRPL